MIKLRLVAIFDGTIKWLVFAYIYGIKPLPEGLMSNKNPTKRRMVHKYLSPALSIHKGLSAPPVRSIT